MLRLALAVTLMSTAFGYSTQGDVMHLWTFWDGNDIDQSGGVCATQSVGATAGPVVTNLATATGHRAIVLGKCYELVSKILPMNNVFDVAGSNSEAAVADANVGSGAAAVTTVSFVNNAGDIELIPYTGTYAHDCASMTTLAAAAVSHGTAGGAAVWACDTGSGTGVSAFSDGTALAANSYTNAQKDVNYVTVGVFTGHAAMSSTHTAAQISGGGSVNGGDCGANASARTGAADEIFGSAATDGLASTAAGRTINFWPVAADKDEANPDGVSATAPTAAEAVASRCYPTENGAGAMQLVCDKETGNITIMTDANDKGCIYSTDTGTNQHLVIAKKGDKCVAADAAGTESWLIRNSDTEWDAICSIPAQTATKQYFTAYLMVTQADCATYGGAIPIAAAENAGTRTVFLDTCYPTDASGQIPGFQGPFSAGTAATEPTAGKAAYMFVKTGDEIVTNQYAYSDCSDRNASGVATPESTLASDDPADSWCVSPAAISHGGVLTAGNAAQLQTATNYLTVRQHTDDTGNVGVGFPGTCLGVNNVTSSTHLDYFRVGSTAADGCHQSAAAASYSWWCDSTDYSINYGTWAATADCSGTQAAGALKFTKKAYDVCAEADAADSATTCTAAGPATTIENPTTMTFSTVLTLVNGATGDFGGKCLEKADNISWEILTDDTTWDAMCGPATPAPTTATTTSGAGKIAATAAAAAAAAAILL